MCEKLETYNFCSKLLRDDQDKDVLTEGNVRMEIFHFIFLLLLFVFFFFKREKNSFMKRMCTKAPLTAGNSLLSGIFIFYTDFGKM